MSNTASYILILHLPVDTLHTIDTLGDIEFPGGFYTYVGNVSDTGQLVTRLKRHLTPIQNPLDDIEHFQQLALLEEIWLSANQLPERTDLVDVLLDMPGSMSLIEGFGGADVESDWDSYLIYFDVRPTLEDFTISYKQQFPDDLVVRAYSRPEEDEEDTADAL